jgi:hypothetical protein
MATEKALGVARLFRIAEERAQSLADETGKVAYLTTNGTQITIDREIAKRWPDMVAIMPKVVARSMERIAGEVLDDASRAADAHVLGGNLGVLAALTVTEVPKIQYWTKRNPMSGSSGFWNTEGRSLGLRRIWPRRTSPRPSLNLEWRLTVSTGRSSSRFARPRR